MKTLTLLLILMAGQLHAQLYTATYNLGDISGPINFTTATPTSCPGTLVINNIPNGQMIDSVIMTYNFFTTLVGFQSVVNQRSYVACPTFSTAESQLTQPLNPPVGTIVSYNRRVTIADGQLVNGPLTFVMYAGSADPLAFASCSNAQNVIMNGTWVVNVYTTNPISLCETPTALQSSAVTHDSANLVWTQADTTINLWQLAYGQQGNPFPTHSLVTAANRNLSLGLLAQATDYVAFVRAICAPGDTSNWSAPVYFTTDTMPCMPPDSSWWFKRGNSTAAFYWTPRPAGTSVDFEFGPAGFTLGAGTLRPNLLVDSVRLTNLQGIAYDYYYRLNCGLSESPWVGPKSFSMSTVSVAPLAFGALRYYPQPTTVHLVLELEHPATFELRDLQGRLQLQGHLEAGSARVDFSQLAAGMYAMQLRNDFGQQQIKLVHQP